VASSPAGKLAVEPREFPATSSPQSAEGQTVEDTLPEPRGESDRLPGDAESRTGINHVQWLFFISSASSPLLLSDESQVACLEEMMASERAEMIAVMNPGNARAIFILIAADEQAFFSPKT